MPKAKPTHEAGSPRRKTSTFRLTEETADLIDRLAKNCRTAPEIRISKADVIAIAVREMAERRLKGT